MAQEFECEVTAIVKIRISDEVADAFTRTEDPEFRSSLYGAMTAENVLYHLAYNAVANGVGDASRLDGWADLDGRYGGTRTITMDVDHVSFESAQALGSAEMPELAPPRPGERPMT